MFSYWFRFSWGLDIFRSYIGQRRTRTGRSDRGSTFVQLAVDVLWELGAGLHVGGVNIQRLAVCPSPLPLLHGLSAHAQYGAPKVLDLWVLHHLKLTDRHPNGKSCRYRYGVSL